MPESGPLGSLVGRLFGGSASRPPAEPGRLYVGSGLAAVAAMAEQAGARRVVGEELAGEPALAGALSGGLSAALGLALGGERAVVFLSGNEVGAASELVRESVRRHAPLVLCVVAESLAPATVAAERGMGVLLPGTISEAADQTLVALLAAESGLVPVALVLDGPTVARSLQEALVASPELVERLIGRPADTVHSSGPAEIELFGEHRRRVPRWHDAHRPLRLGGEWAGAGGRAALAGEWLLFSRSFGERLDAAAKAVSAATGRPLPEVSGERTAKAELALVAYGGMAASAAGLAARPAAPGVRLQAIALHRFAPFPAEALRELLPGAARVVALERFDGARSSGVLASKVASALSTGEKRSEVATLALAGIDQALVASELAAGCKALADRFRPQVVLGLGSSDLGRYPKRQAAFDRFRRAVPEWDDLAASAPGSVDLRPQSAVTLALRRRMGGTAFASDCGRLLVELLGGHLRSGFSRRPIAAGSPERDWLIWCDQPFGDPGEPASADFDLTWVSPPTGESLARLLGALAAAVASRAGRSLLERELRTAAGKLSLDAAALLAGFEAGVALLEPHRTAAAVLRAFPAPNLASAANGEPGALGDAERFWNEVGLPIAEGAAAGLTTDSTLALAAIPACSSPIGAAALGGRPEFLADLCTGCAACWTLCPHSAISVNVASVDALLAAGIAAAGRAGGSAEVLRRFLPKLVERLLFEAEDKVGGRFGDWLETAAGPVFATAGLTEERLLELRAALARVVAEVGEVRVVGTPGLFLSEGGRSRAGGALLALAIDPDRCTGCGLCSEVCEPGALAPWPSAAPVELEGERARVAAMRALPSPAESWIEEVAADSTRGALAAALLSPQGSSLLAGFDAAPAGSASRLAARQTLALVARALAPRLEARRAELRDLAGRLSEAIHTTLGKALPDGDLEALERGLEAAGPGAVDLGALSTRLAGVVASEQVNVARLGRLVHAARAVADLAARLGVESTATGPSFSLVVGPGPELDWARRFPDNPFAVPVTVAPTAPLGVARGLALAEVERCVAAARVVRLARLELDRPQEALHAPERLATLSWAELDEEERKAASPVVVLIDESAGGAEIGEMLAILESPLPLLVATIATEPAESPRSPWWAVAAAADSGIVAHGSVAASAPVSEAALAFAAEARGALVRILAPVVREESSVLDRARRAVEAREFPLGCRIAAAPSTSTALRLDPFAARAAGDAEHEAALAALEERHRQELAAQEARLRVQFAERVRQRLLELAARAGGARSPQEVA